MNKYRKKPVVIEARQYLNDEKSYALLHWINENQYKLGPKTTFATWVNGKLIIPTLEGDHIANEGDWIIQDIKGEFYPCKPDIFHATYDREHETDSEDCWCNPTVEKDDREETRIIIHNEE
jgi:hypothetical protein